MDYATVGILVLEVQEPVLAVFRVYPTALMRAVDGRLPLSQHHLVLVGAVGTTRAHGQLEARGHAARRTKNPVPTVALIELRAFAGAVLGAVAVEHDDRLADGAGAVGRKLAHGKYGGKARTRVGPAVDQVAAAVIVPKGRGVDIALTGNHADG